MTKDDTAKQGLTCEQPGAGLSRKTIEYAMSTEYLGALEHANGSAQRLSSCGDGVEFQLYIDDANIVSDIKFIPKGCMNTRVCAAALCKLVKGQAATVARDISPGDVAAELEGLPNDDMHCATLIIDTLIAAIDDYAGKSSYRRSNQYWEQQFGPKGDKS
jgi:nitrogen fixation NifU-like protein